MRYSILGMILLGLAACSRPVNHMDPYKPDPGLRFGDWQLLPPPACVVAAKGGDIQAVTDGRFSGPMLEVRLAFAVPGVRPPAVRLTGVAVPLPVEGSGRAFAINLRYDPETAAALLQTDSFLSVVYQPLSAPTPREVNFGTRGLVHALAHLQERCR